MTRLEAKQLLGRMTAAWPKQELSAPTAEVWIEHLLPKRADLAADCIQDLELGSKWFPSLAEFQREYDAKVHYETTANAEERGLPAPRPVKASPEFVAGIVAEMKDTVEKGRAKLAASRLDQRGRVNRALEETKDAT